MAMGKSRRRPINMGEDRDNRSDITIYRNGASFVVPVSCQVKDGRVRKDVAQLIRNATKENIERLMLLGVVCVVDDVPEVGSGMRSFA